MEDRNCKWIRKQWSHSFGGLHSQDLAFIHGGWDLQDWANIGGRFGFICMSESGITVAGLVLSLAIYLSNIEIM